MKKIIVTGCLLVFAKLLWAQCNGLPTQCIGSQSFTVTPAAINGHYSNGTVVTFCYTMTDYSQCNSNWFHTLDIDLGPGWDASTITPLSTPNSCDGQGYWDFYTSSTSVTTGITYGPCFSYETPLGNPMFVLDGNPGNNYGDNCTTYAWTFCFSVQVALGCSNQSLSVDVTPIGDGSAGAWSNSTCPGAPLNLCTATCAQCPMDVIGNITNPTCADDDGAITLSTDSAQGPVSFLWISSGDSTSSVNGLSSGSYSVTVTDSVGCAVTDTFQLAFVNPVVVNTTKSNPSCFGYCNGSAFIVPANGLVPYTYNWSNGQTTSFDTALCAGTYYVTIMDANSCVQYDTIVVDQPTLLTVEATHTDATCFGLANGTATIVAAGGANSYTYYWSPSSQTNSTATGLPAGDYSIIVTDTAGCLADTTITISSPPQMLFNASYNDPSCYGFSDGSIVTSVSQGEPPYQYLWMNTGETSSSINNLVVGSYPLVVTDANGCTELDTLTLTQPDSLVGHLQTQPSSCTLATDGAIELFVNGGTTPYSYEWDNNSSFTGSSLYGQHAGTHSVHVADAHNCILNMGDKIISLPELVVEAGSDTSIELGSRAVLNAAVNRNGYFMYEWTPGYHVVDSFAATTEVFPYYTTSYKIKVTETTSGCISEDSMTVKILPTDYVIFPSGFTPNGDGLNDVFLPVSGTLVSIETFRVVNRWGNVIFSDNTQGWDGTFMGKQEEVGTYVYEVAYKVEGRNETYFKSGSVTLLR